MSEYERVCVNASREFPYRSLTHLLGSHSHWLCARHRRVGRKPLHRRLAQVRFLLHSLSTQSVLWLIRRLQSGAESGPCSVVGQMGGTLGILGATSRDLASQVCPSFLTYKHKYVPQISTHILSTAPRPSDARHLGGSAGRRADRVAVLPLRAHRAAAARGEVRRAAPRSAAGSRGGGCRESLAVLRGACNNECSVALSFIAHQVRVATESRRAVGRSRERRPHLAG